MSEDKVEEVVEEVPPTEEEIEAERLSMFKDMDSEELKQFAIGLFSGRIFTDRHLSGQYQLVTSVFMPLSFLNATQRAAISKQAEMNQIGCIWEDISKAGPQAINGFPMFTSMRFMNASDFAKAVSMADKMQEAANSLEV